MPKGMKGFQKGKDNPSYGKHPHNFGKHPSKEQLKNQSESHKGKKLSEEHRKNISLANKGKRKPNEFRQKISGENHHNWKGGKSFQEYGLEWTHSLKHFIRVRDCFVCQICRKNGWMVHHIDYDKKNCNPNNLITVCRSCHMKTNFNRKKWIKYFSEVMRG